MAPGSCSLNLVSCLVSTNSVFPTYHSLNSLAAGTVRALMMGIHAYFNIWCEARAGWAIFIKRRTAVHKISALPEASPDQMRELDDVCSICYQVRGEEGIARRLKE